MAKRQTAPAEYFIEMIPAELSAIPGFNESWRDWCDHRRLEIRKPLSDIAAKRAIKFLVAQPNPVECLDTSIMNGWQGLFPVKPSNFNSGNPDSPAARAAVRSGNRPNEVESWIRGSK